jgi:hypothetical protein
MSRPFPEELRTPRNALVLAHLEPLSAHSDLSDLLLDAVQPLGAVQLFCPDPAACRVLIAATERIVFGFAVGMGTIAFRFDDRMRERALATGGIRYPQAGEEWVAVLHPRPDADWPRPDLRFWALKAYAAAREEALRE